MSWLDKVKGFTAIELLAVMAIVSLLVALTLPGFNQALDYIKLRKDAVELSREIRLVRQRAIATQTSNQIRFYPYYHYYRTYQPTVNHRLDDGIKFLYVSFPPDAQGWVLCRFNPLGVPAAGGTVALQNGKGQKLYVIVSPVTGRVRISSTPPAS